MKNIKISEKKSMLNIKNYNYMYIIDHITYQKCPL